MLLVQVILLFYIILSFLGRIIGFRPYKLTLNNENAPFLPNLLIQKISKSSYCKMSQILDTRDKNSTTQRTIRL